MKNNSVKLSSKEARNMLGCARENAYRAARKYCEEYIALNPTDSARRRRDLDIEICGINNLYYKMIEELERAERISRKA